MSDLEFLYNLREDLEDVWGRLDMFLAHELQGEFEKCENYQDHMGGLLGYGYCSEKDEYVEGFEDCLNCEHREVGE